MKPFRISFGFLNTLDEIFPSFKAAQTLVEVLFWAFIFNIVSAISKSLVLSLLIYNSFCSSVFVRKSFLRYSLHLN